MSNTTSKHEDLGSVIGYGLWEGNRPLSGRKSITRRAAPHWPSSCYKHDSDLDLVVTDRVMAVFRDELAGRASEGGTVELADIPKDRCARVLRTLVSRLESADPPIVEGPIKCVLGNASYVPRVLVISFKEASTRISCDVFANVKFSEFKSDVMAAMHTHQPLLAPLVQLGDHVTAEELAAKLRTAQERRSQLRPAITSGAGRLRPGGKWKRRRLRGHSSASPSGPRRLRRLKPADKAGNSSSSSDSWRRAAKLSVLALFR